MESDEEEENSSFSQLRGSQSELSRNSQINRKSITNDKWFKELFSRTIDKNKLNQIVANYLFIQGYCLPLKKFIAETKIKFDFDEKLLKKRFLIRQLIINNKIDKAIAEINSIDKTILEENKIIHFVLLRQILLKLIQENKIEDALNFAKKEILPLTEGDDFLYQQLENTICLFAYESIDESPQKELIDDKFLDKIASKINLVVLNYLSKDKIVNLNLELLTKLMYYVQNQLKKEMDFPQIISLSPLSFSVVNK